MLTLYAFKLNLPNEKYGKLNVEYRHNYKILCWLQFTSFKYVTTLRIN